jgi:hypothetical protein
MPYALLNYVLNPLICYIHAMYKNSKPKWSGRPRGKKTSLLNTIVNEHQQYSARLYFRLLRLSSDVDWDIVASF